MGTLVQKVYYSTEIMERSHHFHDCHQIIFVESGVVEFYVNGATLEATAGDAVIFSRYEDHAVRVCSGVYQRYVLQIDPEIVNQNSSLYSLLSDRPAGFCNVIHCGQSKDKIASLLQQLIQEQATHAPAGDEMAQCLVLQLLILLLRCIHHGFAPPADDLVVQIKQQFERDYRLTFTLSGLAKQYNVSPSTLSHRFRAATGLPVMEYLLLCRMAYAKRMLANTHLPMGEIVACCGFSDSSNFARTFHQRTGMTPSAFRKKYSSN